MLLVKMFGKVPFKIILGPVRWYHWIKARASTLTTWAGHILMHTHK